MEIVPGELSTKALYKILTGTILPRPIGWISTVDADGQPNLAPFSYFNVVCANPPHVLFCPAVRGRDGALKDTLRNVRATGEFVVNVVTEALVEAMNLTSAELPSGVNEFELAGLTAGPSVAVRPPRVAESPVHFECRVVHVYEVGDWPGAGSVVVGRVVHAYVSDAVLLDDYKIDVTRLQPVGRLAGGAYCRVTDRFELARPGSKV